MNPVEHNRQRCQTLDGELFAQLPFDGRCGAHEATTAATAKATSRQSTILFARFDGWNFIGF